MNAASMEAGSGGARASRAALLALAVICTLVAASAAFASRANADVPIVDFDVSISTLRAGGHPDLVVHSVLDSNFGLNGSTSHQRNSECDCEDVKDFNISLPTGFIGNPHATPQCSIAEFTEQRCPTDSQVGVVEIRAFTYFVEPVYNLVPPPDVPGLLAFNLPNFQTAQYTIITPRTEGDYGLDVVAPSITHYIPPAEITEILWGVPASPVHDGLRYLPGQIEGLLADTGRICDDQGRLADPTRPASFVEICNNAQGKDGFSHPSNSAEEPFLQNPTRCDDPSLASTLGILSYDGGLTNATTPWPGVIACDQLAFSPSLSATTTTSQADAPTGLDVDLKVPQTESPTVPAGSELRAAVIHLPEGMSINPNAADGKTACGQTESKIGSRAAAECPQFAKIGTLEIHSAVLPGDLPGSVYLASPLPGERYRVYLVADGFGVHIKLPGTIVPDPATGRLTVNFQNLPQTPFDEFDLHLFGAERAALVTPPKCGTYSVRTVFTPWDAALADQESTQFFKVDSGPGDSPCPGSPRPFDPSFTAASASNAAGAHTPFAVQVTRADGDQTLAGLSVATPPGFAATLKGIPYCPDAALSAIADADSSGVLEAATPACPAASQVGTSAVAAGSGSRPVTLTGKVYLAGPYKGAPISLAVVTPAVSGPYDLGNVVVRAAIRVDPTTAQVTATSDPIPQILAGIPLRLRTVRVNLDRPGFALNPTSCSRFAVDAALTGAEGAGTTPNAPYQVANCAVLPFAPKLALRLAGSTKRRAHPALTATLQTKPGEANLAAASVLMPKALFFDQAHLKNICTRVQFAAGKCPPQSRLGTARADSPLLAAPLEGPVYLRSSSHKLPDLVVDLHGQFDIVLGARIDSVKRRLRARFESIPDVPVSRFTLKLLGGKKGLLQNSVDLCGSSEAATVVLDGQNEAREKAKSPIGLPCKKAKRKRGDRR